MEWEIKIIEGNRYLEVTTAGVADKDRSLQMAKAIKDTMRQNRITRALIDHRGLSGVSGEIVDIYNRPKLLRFIGLILRIRIAEVVKAEHTDHFKFFETVCFNQGIQLSVFRKKEEALTWLLG